MKCYAISACFAPLSKTSENLVSKFNFPDPKMYIKVITIFTTQFVENNDSSRKV